MVVDASVAFTVVASSGASATELHRRLSDAAIEAPDLLGVEVTSALRDRERRGELTPTQAAFALDRLAELPLEIHPTRPLLRRVWELRHNLTPYDATYVALAEALDRPLLTADRRLANAPGIRCEVELV